MTSAWLAIDALYLIHKLQPMLKLVGYGIGMTGSVLYRGYSAKDLDLLIYPLKTKLTPTYPPTPELVDIFLSIGMRLVMSPDHENDDKVVEIWKLGDKRIDILYLS